MPTRRFRSRFRASDSLRNRYAEHPRRDSVPTYTKECRVLKIKIDNVFFLRRMTRIRAKHKISDYLFCVLPFLLYICNVLKNKGL